MDKCNADLSSTIGKARDALINKDTAAVQEMVIIMNEQLEKCTDTFLNTAVDMQDDVQAAKAKYQELKDEVAGLQEEIGRFMLPKKGNKDIDSASEVSTSVSTTKSLKAKAAIRKVKLMAEMKAKARIYELEAAEAKIKQEKEMLRLEVELQVAAEEEKILKQADEDEFQSMDDGASIVKNNSGVITFKECDSKDNNDSVKDTTLTSVAEGRAFNIEFFEQQRQLIDMLGAPKLEIPVFSGDPLKYYMFIRAFDNSIDKRLNDDTSKLLRLIQYCTGEALTLVQDCAVLEPHDGYKTARSRLRERFGDPVIIAQAWCAHVTNQNAIKPHDGPALLKYSDLLSTCLNTMTAMNALAEISSQSTLLQILNILPPYLAPRWRKQVIKIKNASHRLPSFQDLVEFVKVAAEEANIPLYGNLHVKDRSNKPSDNKPYRNSSSFLISTANESTPAVVNKKCALCSNEHMIWECSTFKEMSVDDRVALVKKENLCFNCLKKGNHVSRYCKSQRRCNVNGCGRRHSYLLHADRNGHHGDHSESLEGSSKPIAEPTKLASQFIDTSCFTGSCNKTVALPIVEVKVYSPALKQYVKTFALLDNASSHSFMNEKLMDELKLETK